MSILMVDYARKDAPLLFTQSLASTGFAVLRGHPVSTDLIFEVYELWREFFLSDLAEKNKYLFHKTNQDGYFPFRSENAKNNNISDLKEFYHIYPWGRIPKKAQTASLHLYAILEKFSAELLEWIENFLPLNVSSQLSMPLKEMIKNSENTLFRVLHYPPIEQDFEKGAIRAAAHEDINLITLLPAATKPGLEVLDANGNWHAVSCDPGNIVVNVGDMLQMCTQHYYKSTTHRVVNPDIKDNSSRFSMPIFLHPRKEVKLSANYTAVEYLTERLREIGIY